MSIEGNVGTGLTKKVQAGADTWASRTLLSRDLFEKLGGVISRLRPPPVQLKAVGGRQIDAMGCVDICVNGDVVTEAYVLVDMGIPTPLLLGDPALRELSRGKPLQILYHDNKRAEAFVGAAGNTDTEIIQTSDCEIRRTTTPAGNVWSYRWVWKDQAPPPLLDGVAFYKKRNLEKSEVDSAMERWIKEGILEPCETPKVLVPFNPVDQREKKPADPVRITGDFKQLNRYIRLDMKEEDNEICSEVIRLIRNYSKGTFLDLKSAYLSIFLDENLRDYNSFKVGDKWYRGTRMLFGISPGQKVLLLVLKKILGDRAISFRDDLFVPDGEKLEEVREILRSNGFVVKDEAWSLEQLRDGDPSKMVLGLCVFRENGELRWCRKPLKNHSIATCRDFASVLGEGSGSHLPCVGPARAELSLFRSILGKFVGGDLKNWDSPVPDDIRTAWEATAERLNQLKSYSWTIPKGIFRLYTDASGILCGGVLRVLQNDGRESEDILDFSSRNTTRAHINVGELHAVVHGLKILADVAPKGAEVHIIVDSKTAASWLLTCINHGIIRSGSMNKVLIRSRLEIIRQSITLMEWKVKVEWIETSKNPADHLTRVPRELGDLWRAYNQEPAEEFTMGKEDDIVGSVGTNWDQAVRSIHEERLHPGYPAMQKICKDSQIPVTSAEIKKLIAECVVCQRKRPQPRYINQKTNDPAPSAPWEWAQIDVLSLEEYKLILIIDEYSKSIEGRVIPHAPNAQEVLKLLECWFARYSGILPKQWHLRSDRGREFFNADVRRWVQVLSVKCVRVLTITNYQEERVKIIYVGEKIICKISCRVFCCKQFTCSTSSISIRPHSRRKVDTFITLPHEDLLLTQWWNDVTEHF